MKVYYDTLFDCLCYWDSEQERFVTNNEGQWFESCLHRNYFRMLQGVWRFEYLGKI